MPRDTQDRRDELIGQPTGLKGYADLSCMHFIHRKTCFFTPRSLRPKHHADRMSKSDQNRKEKEEKSIKKQMAGLLWLVFHTITTI